MGPARAGRYGDSTRTGFRRISRKDGIFSTRVGCGGLGNVNGKKMGLARSPVRVSGTGPSARRRGSSAGRR